MLAASLGVDLELAGVPLDQKQVAQIASVWDSVQNPRTNPAVYEMASRGRSAVSGMIAGHEAIVAGAAHVLSPEQISALKNYFVDVDAPTGASSGVVRD
jgi:hypothetical protein